MLTLREKPYDKWRDLRKARAKKDLNDAELYLQKVKVAVTDKQKEFYRRKAISSVRMAKIRMEVL